MGDISEIRGLLVVGTFLAVTIAFISWIPPELYAAGDVRTLRVPAEFESIDTLLYAKTYNFSFGELWEDWGDTYKGDFGRTMTFLASYYDLANVHYYGFLDLWAHKMHWINKDGIDRGLILSIDEINTDWEETEKVARYKVQCNHFYMYAFIGYNTTIYYTLEEAWDDDNAKILFAIDFDQVGSSWNAWSLISSILFFKMPNINLYLNAIIAIPIWIAVAYIAFILVLRTIGAIFGGGA